MKKIEIKDLTKDLEPTRDLVENFLSRNGVSRVVTSETMLILEALLHNIYEQEGDDAVVTVSVRSRFGSAGIILNFEGDMYISERDYPGELTPEDRILTAYGDRIDYVYGSRFNSIRIQARRSYVGATLAYLAAVIAAIVVYAIVHQTAGAQGEETFHNMVIFPFERLFSNAMMMIGAPVTFLSLLRNLTGIYILSERDSGLRKITRQTIISSAMSVLMAIVLCRILSVMPAFTKYLQGDGQFQVQLSLETFIESLMPADIVTPFMTISPFPLILLAGLVTYAFCSVGKYFDKMLDAIDVCYALFSRMLAIVMFTLPFFTFCAVSDILLVNGYPVLKNCGKFILLVLVSLILPAAYYSLRLVVRKISLPGFLSRLGPLLTENFKIASAIDAVPHNIRYCAKVYSIDRKYLEKALPVLAQVNLDGNCYLLTLISIVFMTINGSLVPLGEMILVGMLVLVLSLGAPNQPGSCIIGALIILHYIQAYTMIPYAILAEVLFGAMLNIMNVTGDIVTVVSNAKPDLSTDK